MATATLPRPAAPKIRLSKLFIDNQWVDSAEGGTIDTLNPATGEKIATVVAGTAVDIDKAHLFAKHVKAGTVWINCYHVIDGPTPFGGFKMSGHGRDFGTAALDHYTELKTVTVKLG